MGRRRPRRACKGVGRLSIRLFAAPGCLPAAHPLTAAWLPFRPHPPLADVKIVAEAHRSEAEGMRAGTPGAIPAGSTPPMPVGAAPHQPTSAAGSAGAPTPPVPASPANSHASAAAAAAAALGGLPRGSVRAASEAGASVGGGEDDDFPLDGEEPARKPAIGERPLLGAKGVWGWGGDPQ